jgi:hypothetical protein
LQLSSVQTFPSLQFGAGPPTQLPPLQVSLVVHALPSLHGALLLAWTHPMEGLQLSSVHTLLSSQFTGSLTHAWLTQRSLVVHWSVSAQSAFVLQQLGTAACWHPVGETQESVVQALPSLQLAGGPATQLPPLQVSLVVQASPSSHGALLLVWTHPVAGLQLSSVQTFPSLQFGAGPPTQLPPLHVSLVVQALPSSHGALLLV